MLECYSKLEEANTRYVVAALIDPDDNQEEANYLNQALQDKEEALSMYSDFLAKTKQLRVDTKRVAKFKTN